jgi:hypothetical protein
MDARTLAPALEALALARPRDAGTEMEAMIQQLSTLWTDLQAGKAVARDGLAEQLQEIRSQSAQASRLIRAGAHYCEEALDILMPPGASYDAFGRSSAELSVHGFSVEG